MSREYNKVRAGRKAAWSKEEDMSGLPRCSRTDGRRRQCGTRGWLGAVSLLAVAGAAACAHSSPSGYEESFGLAALYESRRVSPPEVRVLLPPAMPLRAFTPVGVLRVVPRVAQRPDLDTALDALRRAAAGRGLSGVYGVECNPLGVRAAGSCQGTAFVYDTEPGATQSGASVSRGNHP